MSSVDDYVREQACERGQCGGEAQMEKYQQYLAGASDKHTAQKQGSQTREALEVEERRPQVRIAVEAVAVMHNRWEN